MKLGSFGLASLILFAVAATASGQATLEQAFVSDGSVDIEADLDNTDVTIYYSATLNTLNEVQTLSLSGGESKTIALPDGYYALESNNPVRVLGQPLPEEPTLVVAPTPAIAQTTIQEDPVPPQVHVAPWRGTLPHEIYNGKRARLKAVATQGTAALSQYKWDLTDGYSTGWLAYPGRNLQLDHTFPDGADNKPWGATITVKDSTGFTASDVYNIVVRPESLDTKRHIAIDDGLWWLHKVPTLGGSGETATAYWRPRDGYYMAATGIAVTAFENSGFLPSGDADNPYTDTVQRGLNYLMGTLRRYNFGETDKWFDMGANGYGLCSNTARTFYEGGIVLLAISGAQEPDKIVPAGLGIAEVRGHTYKQVAQEMSDYFGGGQYDSGDGAGGWRYSYNQWPDMSAVQWPVLGMHAAEENLGIDVHSSVKTRLRDHWLVYDQNANGGFGYTHPGETVNVTKTGAGLACFWWVGKDQTDAKVQNAVNYITNNWGTGNVGMFYPMYAVMKGARLASPEIATFGSHNWYTEYCNWLVGSQHNDGYWNDNDTWISPYLGTQMRTAMGVLIMTTAVITQPPVASFTIEPNPADVDIEITFDASASFDPNERPLTYSWDFGDDTTGTGVIATHTYTTQETFTVVLTVANNQNPPQQGIATQQVYITPPNHPPTAIPGGPYSGWIGPSTFPLVTLDGSASYDINAPVDHLTTYEWELDNVFPYDFDEGNTPITQYSFTTAGTNDVALRVTDDPNAGFVNSGLSHTVWTTVEITLDDVPPANSLSIDPAVPGGANDWYLTQPTATITATDGDSGMKAIRYWWDDGAPTDVPGDTAVVPASEGDHVLHYGGVDNVDNFNEETVQIKLDTSTPTTAIHFSTGDGPYGADWYHSAVGLMVHANGGTSGIASAEYTLDAGPWTLYGDSEVVDVLTDGPHTLETKVVTNSGKQTGTSVAFNIDTTQPVTVLTTDPAAPDGSNGWFVTIPNVTLNASDPGGEAIAEIRYRWEGDAGETVAAGNTATFPGSPPVATLHFYAVNENGNPEVEQTAQIKIDLAAPTTQAAVNPPADGSNGWHLTQPTVTVTAADLFGIAIILDGQTSGVALVRYHWDADAPTEVAGSAVALPAAPGEHTLYYEAEDNAGNVSDEQTVDTKYDDSTVTVGIALAGTDLGGGLYAGAVQATLTADGGMSGIDTTEYQINGGASTPFTSPEVVAVTTWGPNQVDAQVVSVSGQTANAQATFDIDAGPTIVSQDPDGHTNQPVSSVTLQTSEPVVGADARDTGTYSLQHLGSDRAPGGGDDSTVVVSPSYIDGTTQIELLAVGDNTVNLSAWGEMDYAAGGSGDWQIEGGGYSVKQYINGAPTFYVSDFDLIDRQFRGKIKVETTSDDDFVGFAFGFQTSGGKPNNFYLLSWKQTNQASSGTGYEGFMLVKITNSASGGVNFWSLPAGAKVQRLASHLNTSAGWGDNVEYEFSFRYQSNGDIDISIRRTSNGAVMWETSVNDPSPLGVGKVAFYNYSQSHVRYSGLQQADFLEEGAYQITAASGNPGLRDTNGTPLDGNADGIAPEDYVGTFVIDQTPPDVTGITIAPSTIEVTYHDLGGIDEATVTDVANYTLLASGGDGSFDDGNEPDLTGRITNITYVAGDGGDGVATLAIAPPLEDELYRLTINGTTSIQDLAGNKLLGGDHEEALPLETGPATVALDLDATTDTGASSDDDLTNQTELLFNVTVNKAGRIGIDFDGESGEDAAQLVSAAGTYQFTSPALADGLHNAGATLDPPAGAQATDALPVTIDTAGPLGVAGAPTELGPLAERQVAFDEDIDPATFDASDVVFTGPGDVDLGAVSGVSGTGAAFTITFPNQTAAGAYSLLIGPDVRDLAGNMLNQNDNDINGEIGADEFDDTFDLVPDTFGPAVTGHEPTGLVGPGITGVRLTFDEWMAAGSFTGDDVAMATPAGNVDSSLIAIALVVDPGNPGLFNTFDVQFPAQTADGPYTLTMGPGITDLTGNPLNQDGDGNNGEPEDVYDATFSVDGLPPITTLATAPPAPDGLDDWFITQPQVTLTATDAGVGVKEIRYWWNDGAPIVASGASASFPA
ncbi:MAG: PKD domain-containing protein, partial [Planctomycetes bacterium]|nr:PKD domain-containing protein [Planctomycetota bacterium]